MKKVTLLTILKNFYPEFSQDRLYSYVLCGNVTVNGGVIRNPKELFNMDVAIGIADKKYVSRGGFKLEKALSFWNIDVSGKIVLDAGSSTGGFTDCLLRNGAMCVYAVDSGFNQLDFKLRQNPKVIIREKTNIMDVTSLDPVPDIAVCDLSFRSIVHAASHILSLTREKILVALIKPQFEERGLTVDFDGVIRNVHDLHRVLSETARLLWEDCSYIADITESPVLGTKGNREFLCMITADEKITFEKILEKIERIK